MDYAEQKGSVKRAAANVDIYRSAGKTIHFLYIYAIYSGNIILHHGGEGPRTMHHKNLQKKDSSVGVWQVKPGRAWAGERMLEGRSEREGHPE